MMKATKKETKPISSIHQRNRKSSFVPIESQFTKKFKYNLRLNWSKYFSKKFAVCRSICNKIIQTPQRWLKEIDFKAIRNDTSLWLFEASLEGFLINYVMWALVGWKLNFITVLAWGFAVKQLLSINERLKNNGPIKTIPTKN